MGRTSDELDDTGSTRGSKAPAQLRWGRAKRDGEGEGTGVQNGDAKTRRVRRAAISPLGKRS